MMLRVYDTLRAEKIEFEPFRKDKIGMYVCGMTVQDKPHVGHMLAFVAGDVIRRYLEHLGYDVVYIQNFTDIDDKILDKAKEEGVDYRVIAERNIEAYFAAAEQLNIKPATHYPRATEHIAEIIALIEKLTRSGHAYPAGGDVYFRVRSYPEYGKLSKRRVDDLKSGARIAVGESKEDPLDFALWKASKENEPGWDSPWGRGRPGWHIECSAMSMKYLGKTLDFHGGGEDLIFPHHENELAQSECATGVPFVRFWLHNGLLNLKGEKMSKSTGHFFAMDDVLREYDGDVVRFYLLSTHFRSQSEYSRDRLEDAKRGYDRLRLACVAIEEHLGRLGGGTGISSPAGDALREAADHARAHFLKAMDDDFNSAAALGALFELIRTYYKLAEEGGAAVTQDGGALRAVKGAIEGIEGVLGLFRHGFPGRLDDVPPEVLAWVEARQDARDQRNFKKADELRRKVEEAGFVLEDTPTGVRVRKR